jgi:hypothetical protein
MGNKGGRPPLDQGKRSFKIDVRFTEAEYRQVEALEKAMGLNKAELVRRRVLYNSERLLLNTGALMKGLDAISLELARSGNNVNQLARYANRLQRHGVLSPSVALAILDTLQAHQRRQVDLQVLFRQLLRELKG